MHWIRTSLEFAVIWSREPRSRSSVGTTRQVSGTAPDNAALQGLQEREHARRWLPAGTRLALEAGALPERSEYLPLHVELVVRYTAELHGENPFEYLVALLTHPGEVAADPSAWLPWTFRATLARASPAAA